MGEKPRDWLTRLLLREQPHPAPFVARTPWAPLPSAYVHCSPYGFTPSLFVCLFQLHLNLPSHSSDMCLGSSEEHEQFDPIHGASSQRRSPTWAVRLSSSPAVPVTCSGAVSKRLTCACTFSPVRTSTQDRDEGQGRLCSQ